MTIKQFGNAFKQAVGEELAAGGLLELNPARAEKIYPRNQVADPVAGSAVILAQGYNYTNAAGRNGARNHIDGSVVIDCWYDILTGTNLAQIDALGGVIVNVNPRMFSLRGARDVGSIVIPLAVVNLNHGAWAPPAVAQTLNLGNLEEWRNGQANSLTDSAAGYLLGKLFCQGWEPVDISLSANNNIEATRPDNGVALDGYAAIVGVSKTNIINNLWNAFFDDPDGAGVDPVIDAAQHAAWQGSGLTPANAQVAYNNGWRTDLVGVANFAAGTLEYTSGGHTTRGINPVVTTVVQAQAANIAAAGAGAWNAFFDDPDGAGVDPVIDAAQHAAWQGSGLTPANAQVAYNNGWRTDLVGVANFAAGTLEYTSGGHTTRGINPVVTTVVQAQAANIAAAGAGAWNAFFDDPDGAGVDPVIDAAQHAAWQGSGLTPANAQVAYNNGWRTDLVGVANFAAGTLEYTSGGHTTRGINPVVTTVVQAQAANIAAAGAGAWNAFFDDPDGAGVDPVIDAAQHAAWQGSGLTPANAQVAYNNGWRTDLVGVANFAAGTLEYTSGGHTTRGINPVVTTVVQAQAANIAAAGAGAWNAFFDDPDGAGVDPVIDAAQHAAWQGSGLTPANAQVAYNNGWRTDLVGVANFAAGTLEYTSGGHTTRGINPVVTTVVQAQAANIAAAGAAALQSAKDAAIIEIEGKQKESGTNKKVEDPQINTWLATDSTTKPDYDKLTGNDKNWKGYINVVTTIAADVTTRKDKVLEAINKVREKDGPAPNTLTEARNTAITKIKGEMSKAGKEPITPAQLNTWVATDSTTKPDYDKITVNNKNWESYINDTTVTDPKVVNARATKLSTIIKNKWANQPDRKGTGLTIAQANSAYTNAGLTKPSETTAQGWAKVAKKSIKLKDETTLKTFLAEINKFDTSKLQKVFDKLSEKPTGDNADAKRNDLLTNKEPKVIIKTYALYKVEQEKDSKFFADTQTEMASWKKDGDAKQTLNPTDYPKEGDKYSEAAMIKFLCESYEGTTHNAVAPKESPNNDAPKKDAPKWYSTDSTPGKWLWYAGLPLVIVGIVVAIFWTNIMSWWNGSNESKNEERDIW